MFSEPAFLTGPNPNSSHVSQTRPRKPLCKSRKTHARADAEISQYFAVESALRKSPASLGCGARNSDAYGVWSDAIQKDPELLPDLSKKLLLESDSPETIPVDSTLNVEGCQTERHHQTFLNEIRSRRRSSSPFTWSESNVERDQQNQRDLERVNGAFQVEHNAGVPPHLLSQKAAVSRDPDLSNLLVGKNENRRVQAKIQSVCESGLALSKSASNAFLQESEMTARNACSNWPVGSEEKDFILSGEDNPHGRCGAVIDERQKLVEKLEPAPKMEVHRGISQRPRKVAESFDHPSNPRKRSENRDAALNQAMLEINRKEQGFPVDGFGTEFRHHSGAQHQHFPRARRFQDVLSASSGSLSRYNMGLNVVDEKSEIPFQNQPSQRESEIGYESGRRGTLNQESAGREGFNEMNQSATDSRQLVRRSARGSSLAFEAAMDMATPVSFLDRIYGQTLTDGESHGDWWVELKESRKEKSLMS